MPRAGKVVVEVSPTDARLIASWMRNLPKPLWDIPRLNSPILANGVRADLVERFDAIATRKRQDSRLVAVGIEIDREDAQFFAAKVANGMFFGGINVTLPSYVRSFCLRCLASLRKRKGRQRLYGAALKQTGTREHLDLRHRKRLRAREREERTDQEFWFNRTGLAAEFFGPHQNPDLP